MMDYSLHLRWGEAVLTSSSTKEPTQRVLLFLIQRIVTVPGHFQTRVASLDLSLMAFMIFTLSFCSVLLFSLLCAHQKNNQNGNTFKNIQRAKYIIWFYGQRKQLTLHKKLEDAVERPDIQDCQHALQIRNRSSPPPTKWDKGKKVQLGGYLLQFNFFSKGAYSETPYTNY